MSDAIARLYERWLGYWLDLPPAIRSAVVDALETGLAAALAVQVVVPRDASGLAQLAVTIASAFAGAFVSAIRRKITDWLLERRSALIRRELEADQGRP